MKSYKELPYWIILGDYEEFTFVISSKKPYFIRENFSTKPVKLEKFLKVHFKSLKKFKSEKQANKFIQNLSEVWKTTFQNIRTLKIESSMLPNYDNGCPNCGSNEILKIWTEQYERVFVVNPEKKTVEERFDYGISHYPSGYDYLCANCNYNLGNFEISQILENKENSFDEN